MKNLYGRFKELFQVVEHLNIRIFGWIFGIYAVVAIHKYFPVLYTWYTFENFTFLIVFQIFLLLVGRLEMVLNFVKQYFQYLGLYLSSLSAVLIVVLVLGILILPTSDTASLLQFALLAFAMVTFLALFQIQSFEFFNRLVFEDRKDVKKVLLPVFLGGIFVFIYTYRYVFGPLHLPYPVLSAIFSGGVFAGGFLFLGTNILETAGRKVFLMSHLQRKTFLKQAWVYGIFSGLVLFSSLGIFGKAWYTTYIDSVTPQAKTESVDNLPAPGTILRDNPVDEFSPALRALIDQEKARNTNSGALQTSRNSGQTASSHIGQTSSGTLEQPQTTQKTIGDIFPEKRYIGAGDRGADVLWIQTFLKKEGYYAGALNQTFDSATISALSRYIGAKTNTTKAYESLGPKTMKIFKEIKIVSE